MVIKNKIPDTVFSAVFLWICVALCCRTMSGKRAADTYLTDQNWDKELPEQEVKDSVLFRS